MAARSRRYAPAMALLRRHGLRPTRQRLLLARLLFETGEQPRHVTAEMLQEEVRSAGASIALATIYNTLHQLVTVGLLAEIVGPDGITWYDTDPHPHHHFFDPREGCLINIADSDVALARLPSPPDGRRIARCRLMIELEA
ncbi:MAG: transcriptional repressor [Alphaproteobacteria bacterium]|nr:MAG: transcriptional repressor [Alphaproteobacteria bacterium]